MATFLQDDLLPGRPCHERERSGPDRMKFIVLPPLLDRGRGGHQEAGVIPPQDHEEVGGGLLQPDLQGGVVEHLDDGNRPVKDTRIGAMRRVQNVLEIPLDGLGIRRGAIVEADAWMQVKDIGAAIVRDVP